MARRYSNSPYHTAYRRLEKGMGHATSHATNRALGALTEELRHDHMVTAVNDLLAADSSAADRVAGLATILAAYGIGGIHGGATN